MATLDVVLAGTMLQTANRGMFIKESAPASQHFEDGHWRFDLGYDGQKIAVDNLEALTHGHHDAWMRVCDSIHWGTPLGVAWATIPGVDGLVSLAFEEKHLLRYYSAPGGGQIPASTHGAWQLEADISHGFQFVFGYRIDPSSGLGATQIAQPFSDELRRLVNHSGDPSLAPDLFPDSGADASEPYTIIVCVSLVCCKPRHDFDPGDVLLAARFYPLVEVIANKELTDVRTRLRLARPEMTTPRSNSNDMMDKIGGVLFTDRNTEPSPIPEPPFWNQIFDYYDLSGQGVYRMAEAVEGPFARQRLNDGARKVLTDGDELPYVKSRVTKQPGQAEFDNLHLAPQMVYLPLVSAGAPARDVLGPDGEARLDTVRYVSMAPFCAHDCLHTHWRWSTAFDKKQNRGWIERDGEYVPYAAAGAPLVPPNQSATAEVRGSALWIDTKATAPRPSAWQHFHHNGFGYGLGVSADVDQLRLLMATPGWPEFYDKLRYAPGGFDTTARKPIFRERLLVQGEDLEALKKL